MKLQDLYDDVLMQVFLTLPLHQASLLGLCCNQLLNTLHSVYHKFDHKVEVYIRENNLLAIPLSEDSGRLWKKKNIQWQAVGDGIKELTGKQIIKLTLKKTIITSAYCTLLLGLVQDFPLKVDKFDNIACDLKSDSVSTFELLLCSLGARELCFKEVTGIGVAIHKVITFLDKRTEAITYYFCGCVITLSIRQCYTCNFAWQDEKLIYYHPDFFPRSNCSRNQALISLIEQHGLNEGDPDKRFISFTAPSIY